MKYTLRFVLSRDGCQTANMHVVSLSSTTNIVAGVRYFIGVYGIITSMKFISKLSQIIIQQSYSLTLFHLMLRTSYRAILALPWPEQAIASQVGFKICFGSYFFVFTW